MKSKNTYKVPIDKDAITRNAGVSPAHADNLKYSIDFECNQGTPIYAARDGTVVFLKDSSNEGGPDRKYWLKGNRIVLKHDHSEYSAYEHLKYQGATVVLGQKVKAGEVIGYSGNTGYSFSPHLHFEVFINPESDESEGETVEVSFVR